MSRYFDHTDDYIVASDRDSMDFPTPETGWTLAGWMKWEDPSGTLEQHIHSWAEGFAGSQFPLTVEDYFHMYIGELSATEVTPRHIGLSVSDGSNPKKIESGQIMIPAETTNKWHHVAVTALGDDEFYFFNDGQKGPLASTSPTGDLKELIQDGDWVIGARQDLEAGYFYSGWLAEWGMWGRALSDFEIKALFEGIRPNQIPVSLQWYLPLWGIVDPENSDAGRWVPRVEGPVGGLHVPVRPYTHPQTVLEGVVDVPDQGVLDYERGIFRGVGAGVGVGVG